MGVAAGARTRARLAAPLPAHQRRTRKRTHLPATLPTDVPTCRVRPGAERRGAGKRSPLAGSQLLRPSLSLGSCGSADTCHRRPAVPKLAQPGLPTPKQAAAAGARARAAQH